MMNQLFATFTFFVLACPSFSQSIVIQRGHTFEISAFEVSADSAFVVTGSKDETVKLWERKSGRLIRTFHLDEFQITRSVAISQDGKYLLAGGSRPNRSGWVFLWEVASGKLVHKFGFDGYPSHLTINSNYYAVGSTSEIHVYDFTTHKLRSSVEIKDNFMRVSLKFSRDGKWFAYLPDKPFENDFIEIYSMPELKKIYSIPVEIASSNTLLAFSYNSQSLMAVSAKSATFRKIELATGKLVLKYEKQFKDDKNSPYLANELRVSKDGNTALVGTRGGYDGFGILLWDIESQKTLKKFIIKIDGRINEIQFEPDKRFLLFSGNDDNYLHEWDIEKNKLHKLSARGPDLFGGKPFFVKGYEPSISLSFYMSFYYPMLFLPGQNSLIKSRFDSTARIWDVATGKTRAEFKAHRQSLFCIDATSDGKKIVTGGGEGKLILWDAMTGDSIKSIQAHYSAIMHVQLSPFNSDQVLSSYTNISGTEIKIHSLASGRLLKGLKYKKPVSIEGWNHLVVWGHEDSYLFHASDSSIFCLETRTGEVIRTLKGHRGNISSIQLSDDRKTLLSSSWDGSVCLWNTQTGLLLHRLQAPTGRIYHAVFSKDEKQVFGANQSSILVWNIPEKQGGWNIESVAPKRKLGDHDETITTLAIDRATNLLASSSRDGVVKFWDLTTEKEFFEHTWVDNKEWIVRNKEGYFSATDNAMKYIQIVEGLNAYPIEQFYNEFYRPDLLPQLFMKRGVSTTPQGSLQDKVRKLKPLQLKVAITPQTEPGKADLFLKIIGEKDEVKAIRILHNGKVTFEDADLVQKVRQSPSTHSVLPVELIGGINQFRVIATNKDGVEFSSEEVDLFSDEIAKNATCYILSIGINKYKNEKLRLAFAQPDAASISSTLTQKTDLFKRIELVELYDEAATQINILKKLDDIAANASLEDVFVLFYAGHGTMVDDKFYFVPVEATRLYEKQDLVKNAIEASLIQKKLSAIKSLKQLIIMDACQSGSSIEAFAVRGAVEEKALAQLSRSAGTHVLASSGSDQFATEYASLKHGVFTYLILEALRGQADGAPVDGKITIYELKAFLDDQVPELTRKLKGKSQYPNTFSRGQDFPIILNPK